LLLLLALFTGAMSAQTLPDSGIPQNLKQYFICFLAQGANWTQPQTKEEHDLLMHKHLAYIRSQVEAGNYSLAGYFLDDGRIRGILAIRAASAEAAKQIAAADPMVETGRLAPEIHPAMLPDLSVVRFDYRKDEVSH
jgi:uncharacterized protein YciI